MGYQLIAYFPPAVAHTAVSFFSHSHAQDPQWSPRADIERSGGQGRCRWGAHLVGARRRAAPLKGVSATTNFLFCFFNEHPVLSSYRWPD